MSEINGTTTSGVQSGDNATAGAGMPTGPPGFGALADVARAVGLSSAAAATARRYFREALAADVQHGRGRVNVAVACVPLAARVHGEAVGLLRVARAVRTEVPESHLTTRRAVSAMMRAVEDVGLERHADVPRPSEYVAGIVAAVESDASVEDVGEAEVAGIGEDGQLLVDETEATAFEDPDAVMREASVVVAEANPADAGAGYSPAGVAAGAVYLVARRRDEDVIAETIAAAAGVSRPTVYKHRDRLRDAATAD